MIDIRKQDVVLTRWTADHRPVLFTTTEAEAAWPIRWSRAICITGEGRHGFLVRLDPNAARGGWTGRQLLIVLRARMAAEAERDKDRFALEAVTALDRAAAANWGMPRSTPETVSFRVGNAPSPYPWTVACQSGFEITLCPDRRSVAEGVAPEQLLIILEQLLTDNARTQPHVRGLLIAQRNVTAALEAEVRRVEQARAEPPDSL